MIGVGYVIALVALFTSLQCKVIAVHPKNGYLAGELTPVWLAYKRIVPFDGSYDMVYERLEAGIVKKAIDYFKSSDFHGIQRKRRVVDGPPQRPVFIGVGDDLRQKPEEFYYPSVLVTMEYGQDWPADKASQDKLIFDKILYALAYWNTINNQLRQIRDPGVQIRIAGFVIARDKDVTPENLKVQSSGIRLYDSFHAIFPYWDKLRETNSDFRQGAFNLVATMTNTARLILTSYGTSTQGTRCDERYFIGLSGLMVWDDFNFYGISQTLGEMAHIMGRSKSGIGAYIEDGGFTADDLATIKHYLKNHGSCWKKPLELYPPGPPVQEITREDLLRH